VSSAVVFLVGAIIACSVGLVLLWLVHLISRRRRRPPVSFEDAMRALSNDSPTSRREPPRGIVTLDSTDEEA